MIGNSPVDRSKLGTKRHVLTDKNGILISVMITSANTHDIKAVTDVIDGAVIIQRPALLSTTKGRRLYLCLVRAYNSKSVKLEIIKRGYVHHMPYKIKREYHQKKERTCQ